MTNQMIIEDLTLVPVPVWWQSPWVLLGFAVVLGGIIYFLRRWWKSRPLPPAPILTPDPGPPPHLEALRRIAELRARYNQISAYGTVTECSDILRVYIEKQFTSPIRYQTTRQFLFENIRHPAWKQEQAEEVGKFLHFFDRIKFAAEFASPADTLDAIDSVERFVKQSSQIHPVA